MAKNHEEEAMSQEIYEKLAQAVIDGEPEDAEEWAKKALEQELDPLDCINKGLSPGIDRVGELFATGEYYLPELMMAGEAAEAVSQHLEAVGLRAPLKQIESGLWTERRDANELYASVQWLDDCNWPYIKDDFMGWQRSRWGQKWDDWMSTGGEEGQEPPDWIKELYEIDTRLRPTGRGGGAVRARTSPDGRATPPAGRMVGQRSGHAVPDAARARFRAACQQS